MNFKRPFLKILNQSELQIIPWSLFQWKLQTGKWILCLKEKNVWKNLEVGRNHRNCLNFNFQKKEKRKMKTKRPKAHAITKRRVFLHSQKTLYIQRAHPTVYSVPNNLVSKTKMVFLCHTYGNERNAF